MRDLRKVHAEDQLDAAIREAEEQLRYLAVGTNGPGPRHRTLRSRPAWYPATEEDFRYCPHLDGHAQPVYATFADPGYVMCHPCSVDAAGRLDAKGKHCGLCGVTDGLKGRFLQVGSCIWFGDLCGRCRELDVAP